MVDLARGQELAAAHQLKHLLRVQVGHRADGRRRDVRGKRHGRQQHRNGQLARKGGLAAERRQRHSRALRVADVSEALPAGVAQHKVHHCGQVVRRHVVPAEVPEGLGASGQRGVVAAEGVASHIAHPNVKSSIRQQESQALEGSVVDPAGAAVQQGVLQQHCRLAGRGAGGTAQLAPQRAQQRLLPLRPLRFPLGVAVRYAEELQNVAVHRRHKVNLQRVPLRLHQRLHRPVRVHLQAQPLQSTFPSVSRQAMRGRDRL
mmetsp:Transcript_26034/g.65658  ORF Transcript_26034/g.65658 Transcript_26034/m.65658 type:complete len:260 (+) Transcript_26034:791-1570(+)